MKGSDHDNKDDDNTDDDEVDDDITKTSDVALHVKCCEILTFGMNDDYDMIQRL